MKTIYWIAGLAAAGIGGYLIYNYLVSNNQIPPIGGGNGVPLFSNSSPSIGFGSGGGGGGIGGVPSDIYDYTITPSNNSNDVSPIQAFKQNYSLLGAVKVVSSPLSASNIPIGYNQSINDISTNATPTSLSKTVYNTSNGLAPYVSITQGGSAFSTNLLGVKPTSGVASNPYSGIPYISGSKLFTIPSSQYSSITSNLLSPITAKNPSLNNPFHQISVPSINVSIPAIQLQNGSIFPVSNYTGGSPSNSYLINNGKAYAGNYNISSGLGAYNVSLNNSKIYQLSNVSNASALLTAGNLSLTNEYAAAASMNYSQLYKLTNSVSNITNSSSSNSSISTSNLGTLKAIPNAKYNAVTGSWSVSAPVVPTFT